MRARLRAPLYCRRERPLSSSDAAPLHLQLREGRAPVRERLIAMLFLTALLHAIVILGVSFSSGRARRATTRRSSM